jgi:hypothetical protein
MSLLATFLQPPDDLLLALWGQGKENLELCLLNTQTLSVIPCFEFPHFNGVTLEIAPDNLHVAVVAEHTQRRAWRERMGHTTRIVTLFVVTLRLRHQSSTGHTPGHDPQQQYHKSCMAT